MSMEAQMDQREKGTEIPVSIGTALAIEAALGILPDMPEEDAKTPAITKVDALWVNMRTLFRNLIGSLDKDFKDQVTDDLLVLALTNEMQIIESAISHVTKGRCEVTFYFCDYSAVPRRFPYASIRPREAPAQKRMWSLEQHTMDELWKSQPHHDFRRYDTDFDQQEKRTLILTNYPVDLLNRYKFKALTLLESHTGVTKSPARWYTKLYDGKDLYNIPFDRMTLQLFGDSVMFSPQPIKIRRYVKEMATKYKWTSVSTKSLLIQSFKDEKDPVLEGFILKLY